MAIFVLVHGACHGAWCYSRVAAKLRKQQHEVYTPTLSGVGELAHLASAGQPINLSTHIQDVVAIFESFDLNDVVLCGHSYGGMVITGAAARVGERIKALVYVDGLVHFDEDHDVSGFDIIGLVKTFSLLQSAGRSGGMMIPPPSAASFEVNTHDVEWVDKMLTPHPLACFVQKLQRNIDKEALVPHRTYVLAERHHSSNHPTYDRVKNLKGWKAVSLDCGHDLMLDKPDELAALLLEELVGQ